MEPGSNDETFPSEILDQIKEGDKLLILTHHNADIDAVGASTALYEFLNGEADLGVPDSVSKGAKELGKGYNFRVDPSLGNYGLVVILDCPSKEQLEPIKIDDYRVEKLLIDHHSPGNLEEIVDTAWIEPGRRSTSEMIYETLRDGGINERAAKALICGIVADTSHLKLAGSMQFKYISELLERTGMEYSKILSILYTPTDFSERVAKIKAASRTEAYRIGEKIIVFSSVGSYEAASARGFLRMGADIAVVFCPRDEEMRISGRCKKKLTEEIHLANDLFSEVKNTINGSAGGHDAAASANGVNMDREEIKNKMLKKLEEIFSGKAERL